MENELKIEYLPVDSLKPYEKNARKHQNADVQTIVASIKEFADAINLPYNTVKQRIENGWSIEDVVNTPYS